MLRKELDKRLELQAIDFDWYDIKQDLSELREVTLEEDLSKLAARTAYHGICTEVFKAVGVAIPPTIRSIT
jgi:hypothetical protein